MKKKFHIVLLTILFLQSSCALLKREDISERRPKPKPGAEAEMPGPTPVLDEEPAPIVQRPKPKVAVVLGPGGYKTFAYASLVKGLQQSGVPVDLIVGIEWGALVGGIWALNGQPHEAEWKLFKLDESVLSSSGFFQSKRSSIEVAQLRKYLAENLSQLDLRKVKVNFTCPTLSMKSGTLSWPKRGSLAKTVENCLISPPHVQPNSKMGNVASVFALAEVAQRLRREGYGVIVLANVIGDEDFTKGTQMDWSTRLYWLEARRSLWGAKKYYTDLIDLNTSAYGLFDVRAKKGLSQSGEAIGKKVGRELVEKYKF